MNLKKTNILQDSKEGLVKKLINLDGKVRNAENNNELPTKNYFEIAGLERQIYELVLNTGSNIHGQLNVEGNALIEGQIVGDITATQILVIGENAVIHGNINGAIVLVFGNLTGDVVASEKLVLCSTQNSAANVMGNICSRAISIQEGVSFEGGCRMGGCS